MSYLTALISSRIARIGAKARSRLGLVGALVAAALTISLVPAPAEAKSQRVIHYSFEQVWPAVIRFLRVDAGCDIEEKDPDAGYLLFLFPDEGKQFRGSLEIVRVRVNERDSLRILIGLEDRPAYMEAGLLERFERKLRAELGPPTRAKPTPTPTPTPPAAQDAPNSGEQ